MLEYVTFSPFHLYFFDALKNIQFSNKLNGLFNVLRSISSSTSSSIVIFIIIIDNKARRQTSNVLTRIFRI